MERVLRKKRSELVLSGVGAILLGIWAFIKVILMILFAVMGILSLILNRKKIRAYVRQNPVNNRYVSWFFSSSGVIVLILFMLYSIAQSIIRI